jgi:hypothetical protein
LCRRAAYELYRDAVGARGADELDARLHRERIDGRVKRRDRLPYRELPSGVFVDLDGKATLVTDDELVSWTAQRGYTTRTARPPSGDAVVLTPLTTLNALRSGYPLQISDAIAT